MTIYSIPRRGLGGHTTATLPTPPSSDYRTILSGISSGPLNWLEFDDTDASTVAVNDGSATPDGAYVNNSGITFRLQSLISGDPTGGGGMRSIAMSGSLTTPPRVTLADVVTGASYTVDLAVQLDRLPATGAKFILATQGLTTATTGATSMEVLADGRIRWWTVTASGLRDLITVQTIAAAAGTKLTFRQENGVGRSIYINGALASGGSDVSVTTLPAPPAATWHIGAWPDGNDPYDGLLCELAAWNAAIATSSIATIGARAQTVLELDSIPAQTFAGSSSGTLDPAALGAAHPHSGWTIEIVAAGTNASLTSFALVGPGNTTIAWTTSATAGSASPQIRLTKSAGAIVSITRTISITITAAGGGGGGEFDTRCTEGGGGTVVNLGSATNKETVTELSSGGNARYNATGIIARCRWLGSQGCTSPENRHSTTLMIGNGGRITVAHNGGCITGLSGYGNLTRDDDYDTQQSGGFALYPCADGGHLFMSNNQTCRNFTIEHMRWHGGWDPVKTPGKQNSTITDNITLQDSWFTCVRDDVIENDGNHAPWTVRRVLVGDTIGTNIANFGPTQSGCWRFMSMTGPRDNSGEEVLIEDCLWHSSRFRATHSSRAPQVSVGGVSGYAVAQWIKIQNLTAKPRIRVRRCVFMSDGLIFGGSGANEGNPFNQMYPGVSNSPFIEHTNNTFIWSEHAEAVQGTWASQGYSVPSGWTVLTGAAGRNEWNARVAEWKQDHPLVRRFNITGIARPFGGTFNLVDTG